MAGKGDKRRPEDHDKFSSGYDAIFSNNAKGGKFRECPETGSWIPEHEYLAKTEQAEQRHYVQPDLEPFQLPGKGGAVITSRRDWRNHLAKTNSIEMGHSDIQSRQRDMDKEHMSRQKKSDAARKRLLIDVANSKGMSGFYEGGR